MLLKLTTIFGCDNSGCSSAKVLQLYSKHKSHIGEFIKVVMKRFDKRRKLQPKRKYMIIPVHVTPMLRRILGCWFRFTKTFLILLADNQRKLLGTRMYGCSMKEVRKMPLDRSILQKIRSYSYYTM